MMWVAGSLSNKAKGFSLLEMLIVVLVVGILYSLAGSMLTQTVSDPLSEEVDRLRERVLLAQDEAVVRSQALGLQLDETGYAFYEYSGFGGWKLIEKDSLWRRHEWRGKYQQTLYLDGQAVSLSRKQDEGQSKPQISILPTGEMRPFEWHLRDGQRESIVKFDAQGRLLDAARGAK
ncbi:MAG TPA: type II secretion system minor pseudopilin GspH [Candidatus Thiothrix moscowensis]|uniref:type II secretion system minor pseudopilin GspH n=1 Tax=unclassified Thiothrix TaxID=2636184 RepID=UPI0025EA63E9|nr:MULTISPECIES: type II secretion system minor pseudopilin GspH [unclassified Thiothrix]HRJ53479.1 type II secretion system minor pseudopilin GspH [Candidatus Thiothrix moscowensis]HRJ93558.1 type II secretion system minor pseudopilin GspH [Candidatus Thiothrix moscowensis]